MPSPALVIARKFGVPVLLWLLRRIGPETAWNTVQQRVEAVGDRQQAIRKARMTNGRFGSWIAEGRTRWVVFAGDEPIDAFPPLDGDSDLAHALRHYDRSRLQHPDELRTVVARRRFTDAVKRLRDRLHRGEEPGFPTTGLALPRKVDAHAAESAGRAALERLADALAPLLDELTAAPERPAHEAPTTPGVFLVTDHGAPVRVGEADDLRQALATEATARWVEVADPFRRTLFEPYATELLGTPDQGAT
jgi:DNA-binding transcriptional MerR regulator